MNLQDIARGLDLTVLTREGDMTREVTGGYASDLLSDVLANSRPGNVWVTLQVHRNVIAVASAKDLAGVILVNGRTPDEETIAKADAERMPVLVSRLSTFALVGRLHGMGLTGCPP